MSAVGSHTSMNEHKRAQWIRRQLKSLPAGWRLLDAGAGEQQYRDACAHLKYVSQDFAAYKPDEKNTGLQMPEWNYGKLDIISDIVSIPEPDASFDAILCSEVLEHIPDPIKAIKEFSRLLRKGGKLILTAPFCSMTHFAPHHYATGFSMYFYEKHLPENDFTIVDSEFNGNYFDYLEQELRRVDSVAQRYGNQQPSWVEYQAMKSVRKMLLRFSMKGDQSSELLSFGIHVLAERK